MTFSCLPIHEVVSVKVKVNVVICSHMFSYVVIVRPDGVHGVQAVGIID